MARAGSNAAGEDTGVDVASGGISGDTGLSDDNLVKRDTGCGVDLEDGGVGGSRVGRGEEAGAIGVLIVTCRRDEDNVSEMRGKKAFLVRIAHPGCRTGRCTSR